MSKEINTLEELIHSITAYLEPSEEEIKEECLESLERLGLKEFVDMDNLEQTIKSSLEDDNCKGITLDYIPEFDVDYNELAIDLLPEESKFKLNLGELFILNAVLELIKPNKVAKKMIKEEAVVNMPYTQPFIEHSIDNILSKVESAIGRLIGLALKDSLDPDKKITFKTVSY